MALLEAVQSQYSDYLNVMKWWMGGWREPKQQWERQEDEGRNKRLE